MTRKEKNKSRIPVIAQNATKKTATSKIHRVNIAGCGFFFVFLIDPKDIHAI